MQGFLPSIRGDVIFNIYTVFVAALVLIVLVVIYKTFPIFIKTKKDNNPGMIKKRIDKAFRKEESSLRGRRKMD
jgi:hypothetical protein